MRIQSHAFPVTYLNAICTKHNCSVSLRVEEAKPFQKEETTGVQLTALRCTIGGMADSARDDNCEHYWQMQTSTPGPITIPSQ